MIGKLLKGVATAAAILAIGQTTARATTKLDITPTNTIITNSANVTGGTFIVASTYTGNSGTGNLDPFLQLQMNGAERAYNTALNGSTNPNGGNLDEKPGSTVLTLGNIPVVTIGGVQYREFILDINQVGNGIISLNQVQIFSHTGDMKATSLVDATPTTEAIIGFTGATEVFKLNNSPVTSASLEVLIDSGNGSGSGDMYLYVLNSAFGAATNSTNVILFSQFGKPPGTDESTSGLEEGAVREGGSPPPPAVPEPGTIALALTGLGTLGFGRLRRNRRKQTVEV